MLTVWATGLSQWINIILTFLTLNTIVRPIYQAALLSDSFILKVVAADSMNTLQEFQNIRWLNCKSWNYSTAVTSKWFSLVTEWSFLGDSTGFLPYFQFIVSSGWLVAFYVWKHLQLKHDTNTVCTKVRLHTVCYTLLYRQLCFKFCIENINSYVFIYDFSTSYCLFDTLVYPWNECIYVFYMYVCVGGAIWVVRDFKQGDCFLKVCKQYVIQQL